MFGPQYNGGAQAPSQGQPQMPPKPLQPKSVPVPPPQPSPPQTKSSQSDSEDEKSEENVQPDVSASQLDSILEQELGDIGSITSSRKKKTKVLKSGNTKTVSKKKKDVNPFTEAQVEIVID
jgi:hypothetical protein